jgi:hypothetical protein
MPVAVGDIDRVTPSEDHRAAKSVSSVRVSSGLSALRLPPGRGFYMLNTAFWPY